MTKLNLLYRDGFDSYKKLNIAKNIDTKNLHNGFNLYEAVSTPESRKSMNNYSSNNGVRSQSRLASLGNMSINPYTGKLYLTQ